MARTNKPKTLIYGFNFLVSTEQRKQLDELQEHGINVAKMLREYIEFQYQNYCIKRNVIIREYRNRERQAAKRG